MSERSALVDGGGSASLPTRRALAPSDVILFRVLHISALVIHILDGSLGLAVVLRNKSITTRLAYELPQFHLGSENVTTKATTNNNGTCSSDLGTYSISYGSKCAGPAWDGLLALVIAEFTTAAFHLYYLLEVETGGRLWIAQRWWLDGFHAARWVEYSISASIISFSNLTGVGVRNIPALVIAAAALVCVQLCGFVMEIAHAVDVRTKVRAEGLPQRGRAPSAISTYSNSILPPHLHCIASTGTREESDTLDAGWHGSPSGRCALDVDRDAVRPFRHRAPQ